MDWHKFTRRYFEIITKNELMALGGQVTYYMILSFFPLIIFFLTLISYADINSEHFFNDLKYLLPEETYLLVESIIYETFAKRSPALLSFGMLAAIWASLNGINALMHGIVKTHGLKENRSFLKLKLTSVLFLIIITITLIFSIITLVFGETLGIALFKVFGATRFFPSFWQNLKLLIQFVLLVLTFIILNRMATGSRYTFKMVFPGSLFAATGWIVISLLFSQYVKHFNNYTLTYGSIGGVMILLLWLYWSSEILLLGSALNAVLIESRKKRRYKFVKN